MKGSYERVRRVLEGERPDRIPLFDLIANDAVMRHFNHCLAVAVGDDGAGIHAIARAVDGSRWSYFSPMVPCEERLPDGRQVRRDRWTQWTEHRVYSSADEYREVKLREIQRESNEAVSLDRAGAAPAYSRQLQARAHFGDDFYCLLYAPSPELMWIYGEVGVEPFSYFLADCEEAILEQLEWNTERACRWIEALPVDDPFPGVFLGEDIAFKTGTLVSPRWLRRHYFPLLRRVVAALHARGKKVIFHSDGNLNAVLDDLVEAGIDALNPVEVAAGMNVAEIHRRHPRLVFVGAIDVSRLLPFGSPAEVRDVVVRTIDDADGQILVGSSTEVMDNVPLENYLAMRAATIGNPS